MRVLKEDYDILETNLDNGMVLGTGSTYKPAPVKNDNGYLLVISKKNGQIRIVFEDWDDIYYGVSIWCPTFRPDKK